MVHDDVGAVLAHGLDAGVGAAAADHRQPARVGELDTRDPDAAGGAVDQHRFAGPRVRPLKAMRGRAVVGTATPMPRLVRTTRAPGSRCSCDGTHSASSAYVPAPATVGPTPAI